jgi:uncharacterized protein (DUF1778 family)
MAWLSRKEERKGTMPGGVRNTVAIRLSGPEREQIARAATRQKLTFSGFVRQAALQASAIVTEKATIKAPERKEPEAREAPFVLVEEERPRIVDGLRILPDGRVVDWEPSADS